MRNKKTIRSSITLAMFGLACLAMMSSVHPISAAHAQNADSMWVDPSSTFISNASVNVGDRFNVTVWTNVSVPVYTWQVELSFNPAQVQAVRAKYTGGSTSLFFQGHTTVPVSPVIDNATGVVIHGESLVGFDQVNASSGSLFWAEFEIMAPPDPTSGMSSSVFNITSPTGQTFWLTPTLDQLAPLTLYEGLYTYGMSPTIGEPVKDPAGDVDINVPCTVTVNVTDPNGIENVTLYYSSDDTWTAVNMTLVSGSAYGGTIPGFATAGTHVKYNITAFNSLGLSTTIDNGTLNYKYNVIPEFTLVIMLVLMVFTAASLVVFKKRLIR